MQFAPNGQPNPQNSQTLLPWMLWIYTLLFSVVLPGILFFVVKGEGVPPPGLPPAADVLFPKDWREPIVIITYALAVAGVAVALIVPKRLVMAKNPAERTGPALLVPYIVRLCSLEVCTVAGFVLGFMHSDPFLAWPLASVGLLMILLSAPVDSFFNRLAS